MSSKEVLMPSLGEGVNEATLIRWLKSIGDKVDQDEPIVEISTDKVDTEIPSPFEGFLISQLFAEGDIIKVDAPIATIGATADAKVATPSAAKKKAPAEPEAKAKPDAVQESAKPDNATTPFKLSEKYENKKSSPLVRKIAKEKNIDLSHVKGTGLGGRITKKDLDTYLKSLSRSASSTLIPGRTTSIAGEPGSSLRPAPLPEAPSYPGAPIEDSKPVALETTFVGDQEFLDGVPVVREKMSRMRTLIAKHMTESVRTSPHVTTNFEIDLHKVVKIREQHKEEFEKQNGFKLTYTPFLLHATIQAIKRHPIVNTSLDGDTVLFKNDINLGCAVAINGGLIVPVIKQSQDLSLGGVARRLNDLVTRARSKKLSPDDVKGGTFSVTNPGGFGSISSNPIINQPQVAILSIGAIVKKPVALDEGIGIRPMCVIGLTFDHRVIDGEGGAKYLADLKQILETYDSLPT